jgi:hydroxypyruvate isomerase
MKYSACIEWLFADESDDFADRVRSAAANGFSAVEFWFWSNKDLDAIEAALNQTGLRLAGCVCEPMIGLNDPANHAAFLDGLRSSIAVAQRLGASVLIAQAGAELPDVPRAAQRAAMVACLSAAADILNGSGVRLAVEPLNTLVDHAGYFLSSTAETLEIIAEVDRPEIGIVYDVYHSAVMGERTEEVLAESVARVLHVHVADHPGRGNPGTGTIELAPRLAWIFANGYDGLVGLEYRPSAGTAAALPAVFAALGGT